MKREEAQVIINNLPLVQAIADGKTLQWATTGYPDRWFDFANVEAFQSFAVNANILKRVKPEPVVKELYAAVYSEQSGLYLGAGRTLAELKRVLGDEKRDVVAIKSIDGKLSAEIITLTGDVG